MNANTEFSKPCHRCENVVRMTADEFRADPQTWTTCEVCRAILTTEAAGIGQGETIPKRPTE